MDNINCAKCDSADIDVMSMKAGGESTSTKVRCRVCGMTWDVKDDADWEQVIKGTDRMVNEEIIDEEDT